MKKGVNVDIKGKYGWTALIITSQKGHLDVVTYLVESGTKLNARSEAGNTSLIVTSGKGYLDIIIFLVENGC